MNKWLPFALVPLVLGSLCLAPCVPHELRLIALERRYRAIVHPPESRALARESALGLLEGNGNHCDYFVGELRAYRRSLAELQSFYGQQAEVEEVALPPRYVSSPRDRLQVAASHAAVAPGETLFLVYVFDQQAPGGDFRCH